MAILTRQASRKLSTLSQEERKTILLQIADKILQSKDQILSENSRDIEASKKEKTSSQLVSRLSLSSAKLDTVVQGIRAIANEKNDPIGKVLRRIELATGLILEQVTVPLGVLLVIFESRPDVLPQVAALALMSGNGLLLKGGKEAQRTNKLLHQIISKTVVEATNGKVPGHVISLVETRDTISELLQQKNEIDLVIPRGSGELVNFIQQNTKIPVTLPINILFLFSRLWDILREFAMFMYTTMLITIKQRELL
jgi:gamma-glutamyl phosphate reductase